VRSDRRAGHHGAGAVHPKWGLNFVKRRTGKCLGLPQFSNPGCALQTPIRKWLTVANLFVDLVEWLTLGQHFLLACARCVRLLVSVHSSPCAWRYAEEAQAVMYASAGVSHGKFPHTMTLCKLAYWCYQHDAVASQLCMCACMAAERGGADCMLYVSAMI
jgi:hypothetical protein